MCVCFQVTIRDFLRCFLRDLAAIYRTLLAIERTIVTRCSPPVDYTLSDQAVYDLVYNSKQAVGLGKTTTRVAVATGDPQTLDMTSPTLDSIVLVNPQDALVSTTPTLTSTAQQTVNVTVTFAVLEANATTTTTQLAAAAPATAAASSGMSVEQLADYFIQQLQNEQTLVQSATQLLRYADLKSIRKIPGVQFCQQTGGHVLPCDADSKLRLGVEPRASPAAPSTGDPHAPSVFAFPALSGAALAAWIGAALAAILILVAGCVYTSRVLKSAKPVKGAKTAAHEDYSSTTGGLESPASRTSRNKQDKPKAKQLKARFETVSSLESQVERPKGGSTGDSGVSSGGSLGASAGFKDDRRSLVARPSQILAGSDYQSRESLRDIRVDAEIEKPGLGAKSPVSRAGAGAGASAASPRSLTHISRSGLKQRTSMTLG